MFLIRAHLYFYSFCIIQMERSPVITWVFHMRAVSLFSLLLLVDYLFVKHSWSTLNSRGFSVDIVFGLEVSIKWKHCLLL